MSQENRAAYPHVTIGSRWDLNRRTSQGDIPYTGIVFEIDWTDCAAHVYDEAEHLHPTWVPFAILVVPAKPEEQATEPVATSVKTLHELEAMADALIAQHNSAVMAQLDSDRHGRRATPPTIELLRFVIDVKRKLLQMRGADVPPLAE